jgi:hypothetical protein
MEGGEEPVAGCIHLAPTETIEILPDDGVMRFQEIPPTQVSHLGGERGRASDISEHNRGQESPLRPTRHAASFCPALLEGNQGTGARGPHRRTSWERRSGAAFRCPETKLDRERSRFTRSSEPQATRRSAVSRRSHLSERSADVPMSRLAALSKGVDTRACGCIGKSGAAAE